MIYSLCYISTKRTDLLKSEINSIIETSKIRNETNNISGILIEYKNHFIQHIEGDAVLIYELFEKIKSRYDHQISPYYAAARIWTDAVINPLDTRTWVSMGIEAANQAPIDRKFNLGVVQV